MLFDKWESFDNSWLLESALDKFPQDYHLHSGIRGCKKILNGCYFVSPENANKSGSEWQFEKSITIEDTKYGDVVLDILKDGRVGSIEYLDRVLGRDT